MYKVMKEFKFCAAHMLESCYTQACRKVHGHNYRVEVVMQCPELNRDGMVIDFGKIKDVVKPLIDEWDHKMILKECGVGNNGGSVFLTVNPTAENMAKIIFSKISEQYSSLNSSSEKNENGHIRAIRVCSVRVYETDSSWAEYGQ